MKLTPARYQDLLDGKTLYHRVRKDRGVYEFLEILPGRGQHCPSNMEGESFLMGWRWKDFPNHGSQGHLPVACYKTASDFRLERQSEPVLYVEVIEQDPNSQIAL
jgi:hypothetical protein